MAWNARPPPLPTSLCPPAGEVRALEWWAVRGLTLRQRERIAFRVLPEISRRRVQCSVYSHTVVSVSSPPPPTPPPDQCWDPRSSRPLPASSPLSPPSLLSSPRHRPPLPPIQRAKSKDTWKRQGLAASPRVDRGRRQGLYCERDNLSAREREIQKGTPALGNLGARH